MSIHKFGFKNNSKIHKFKSISDDPFRSKGAIGKYQYLKNLENKLNERIGVLVEKIKTMELLISQILERKLS